MAIAHITGLERAHLRYPGGRMKCCSLILTMPMQVDPWWTDGGKKVCTSKYKDLA